MFKGKTIKMTIRTRERNEDDQKIEILAGSYKLSETELINACTDKNVLVMFEMNERLLNKFMKDLEFLNVVGVYGERI